MSMKPIIQSVLITFALAAFLVACAPARATAQTGTAPGAASGGSGDKTSASAATTGDLPARLSALGFHVFPEPVALPLFTAQALDTAGQALDPDSFKGTVTLLNFWATWCPPCKGELPSIDRLAARMKGLAFRVAAVSVGEKRETVRSFIAEKGYAFPVYLDPDGSLGSSFASQGIPTTYIVDKRGRVVAGIVGAREYDDPRLIAILEELARQ